MLQSLNHLTLAVSDLQKSVTFWHELLGLALHARWNTGAYLTCGDLWVCLSYDEARQYVPPQESDYTHYAFSVAAEQFAELTHQRMPVFEMPNGDILYARYNRDKDTLDVGTATNAGMAVQHHYPYDHNMTLEANLQAVNEKLNELEEYREELQEAEYGGGLRR